MCTGEAFKLRIACISLAKANRRAFLFCLVALTCNHRLTLDVPRKTIMAAMPVVVAPVID
jgi:hypothetical protein